MHRTIAAAAAIFAVLAFVLHHQVFNGPMVEPVLLLTMGSFFLFAARVTGRDKEEAAPREEPQHTTAILVPERQRVSA